MEWIRPFWFDYLLASGWMKCMWESICKRFQRKVQESGGESVQTILVSLFAWFVAMLPLSSFDLVNIKYWCSVLFSLCSFLFLWTNTAPTTATTTAPRHLFWFCYWAANRHIEAVWLLCFKNDRCKVVTIFELAHRRFRRHRRIVIVVIVNVQWLKPNS